MKYLLLTADKAFQFEETSLAVLGNLGCITALVCFGCFLFFSENFRCFIFVLAGMIIIGHHHMDLLFCCSK
jgi:hypothetical protein